MPEEADKICLAEPIMNFYVCLEIIDLYNCLCSLEALKCKCLTTVCCVWENTCYHIILEINNYFYNGTDTFFVVNHYSELIFNCYMFAF